MRQARLFHLVVLSQALEWVCDGEVLCGWLSPTLLLQLRCGLLEYEVDKEFSSYFSINPLECMVFPLSFHPFSKNKIFGGWNYLLPFLCNSLFFSGKTKGTPAMVYTKGISPTGVGLWCSDGSNLSSHIWGGRNSINTSKSCGWSQKDRSPEAKLGCHNQGVTTTVLGLQWSENDLFFCVPQGQGLRSTWL